MYNLISHLNVEQNIDVGKYLSKNPLDKEELLQTLGLKEHRYKQPNPIIWWSTTKNFNRTCNH